MNFLAHARLSFSDPEVLVGNMISDFVKGRQQYDYPAGIQKGIRLHRAIDQFTDTHPVNQEAKQLFRPAYRLYAGALVDVVYDHFLASDEEEFNEASLRLFAREVYAVLRAHEQWLPERFARMFPYMESQDWLSGYRHLSGTHQSLEGLVRRSAYMDQSRDAVQILELHYQPLREYFRQFWVDARKYAHEQYQLLQST